VPCFAFLPADKLSRDMEIFDQMPRKVRDLVNYAPINIDLATIPASYQKSRNAFNAYNYLLKMLADPRVHNQWMDRK
jgi:hypothetical protein